MQNRPQFLVRSLGRSSGQDPALQWDITPKRKDLFYIPPDVTPLEQKCGRISATNHDAFDVVSSEFIRTNNLKVARFSETGKKFMRKHFGRVETPASAAAARLYQDAGRKERQRRAHEARELQRIRRDANMKHTKRRAFLCST